MYNIFIFFACYLFNPFNPLPIYNKKYYSKQIFINLKEQKHNYTKNLKNKIFPKPIFKNLHEIDYNKNNELWLINLNTGETIDVEKNISLEKELTYFKELYK